MVQNCLTWEHQLRKKVPRRKISARCSVSKIRGDALLLPIAKAGGFRTLGTALFKPQRLLFVHLSPRLGFSEGTLRLGCYFFLIHA